MNSRKEGISGEELAIEYLKKQGLKVVEQNVRMTVGEIDVVCYDGDVLVFVEVKLRKNANFAQAREFVDYKKQQRLRTTASLYLSRCPTTLQPRFDVIEVYAPQGMETVKPVINHLEDAFQ